MYWIQVPEGTKDIKVGTLIALTVDADEDWKTVEMPDTPAEVPAAAPAAAAAAEPSAAPAAASEPPPGQYDPLINTLARLLYL